MKGMKNKVGMMMAVMMGKKPAKSSVAMPKTTKSYTKKTTVKKMK